MNTPLIISHRGNLYGPNSCKENSVGAIFEALNAGFDVEVDLFDFDGYTPNNSTLILGHDRGEYCLNFTMLRKSGLTKRIWWHAKTKSALHYILEFNEELGYESPFFNYFAHSDDHWVVTNRGIPWVHYINPKGYFVKGIQVLPENCTGEKDGSVLVTPLESVYGICTDYCYKYQERFNLAPQTC